MLNPKIYSTTIMPDPNFVFNTTGVKITYKSISRITPINFDKCQLDDSVPRTCPLKCSSCDDESIENTDCLEELIPCTPNYEVLKLCQLKQQQEQKCSLDANCTNNDEPKSTSCNISTKQSCCNIVKTPKSYPEKPRKCSSDTTCINNDKSPKCSTNNDETLSICPLTKQNCPLENSCKTNEKSIKNTMCNVSNKQQLSYSTNDETSNICPSSKPNSSIDTSCKVNSNNNTKCNNISIKQQLPCSTTKQQNCLFQNSINNNNSKSYKLMNNAKSENDSRCCPQQNKMNSFPNSECMNNSLQNTFQTKSIYNDEPKMSSTKHISNSFCCNDQNLNSTKFKPTCLSNNNQSNNVRNDFCGVSYPANSSLNNSSNYNWTMTSNEQSLNNSSNYNWTKTSNEQSLDQNCAPKNTNTYNNSNRSQNERKCDHCSSMEPIHQGLQCNNNQISTHLLQNSRKTGDNLNQSCRYHNAQKPYGNSQNILHLIRSPNNVSYKNKNMNLSHKNNNLNRHPQLKPRSASVPCSYNNKSLQNIKCKEGKSNYKDQNDSCPANLECKQYNIPNGTINKSQLSATNYLNKDEKMITCKVDDNWDPDVGSYSEFTDQNSRNDDPRFLKSKKNCNNISDENFNSDFSVEIGFNGPQSGNFNSTESFMTNTSYSSNVQRRPCNCPECNPIFMDEYNRNNNQVDGDFNRINENSNIRREFDDGLQNSPNIVYPILDEDHINIKDYSIMDFGSDWEDDYFNSTRNNFDNMSCENPDLNNEYEDLRDVEMPNDRSYASSNNMSMDEEDCPDIRDTSFPNNSYDQLSNTF